MITLSRGLNPNESAWMEPCVPGEEPFDVLAGSPSWDHVLDALGGWALARELDSRTGRAACAALRHGAPAGAALGVRPARAAESAAGGPQPAGPTASAVLRARGSGPGCAQGDFVAVSRTVGFAPELFAGASGVIAPRYSPSALARLRELDGGRLVVLQSRPAPPPAVRRSVTEFHGLRLVRETPEPARFLGGVETLCGEVTDLEDLTVAALTARQAPAGSMVFAVQGRAAGFGTGHRDRLDESPLAAGRARTWLRRHGPDLLAVELGPGAFPAVTLAADEDFALAEVVEIAAGLGVTQLVTPRGAAGPAAVLEACARHGMSWTVTGDRFSRS